MLITPKYLELNAELHRRVPTYGNGGHRWSGFVRQLAAGGTVLDYGCGKGTLRDALQGLDVREYDPAVPGKDAPPEVADVVVCGDVMEHVEPEFTMAVLSDVCSLGRRSVFFVISCVPSKKTLADGRDAHINVKPADWWRKALSEFGEFVDVPTADREYAAVWNKAEDSR